MQQDSGANEKENENKKIKQNSTSSAANTLSRQ
jgi:hypothetical protein